MHFASSVILLQLWIATTVGSPYFLPEILSNFTSIETENREQRKFTGAEYVVEVAIVCDSEFGQMFQYNELNIRAYWTAFFLDLQQRFRTLSSSKIYFRIISIYVIKGKEYERFLDSLPLNNGKLDIPAALKSCQDWIEKRFKYWPKFDVAMVVTGLPHGDVIGTAFIGGACDIDYTLENVQSIMLMSIRTTDPVTVAAHEMAHLLGSNHDNEPWDCESGFIMSEEADRINFPYHFSSCSDKAINKFVSTEQAQCLRQDNHYSNAIIDTRNLTNDDFDGVSVQQQCKMLLNNPNALVKHDEGDCKAVTCMVKNPTNSSAPNNTENLNPIDGRHCQNKGVSNLASNYLQRCSKGSCKKPEFKLVNIKTGTCLLILSGYNSSERIKAIFTQCSQPHNSTHFPIFTVTDMGPFGIFLMMLFDLPSQPNAKDEKCLGNKKGTDSLALYPCSKLNEVGWDFIRVNSINDGAFILRHRITKMCVTVSDNFTTITSACSLPNPRIRWILMQPNENVGPLNSSMLPSSRGVFDVNWGTEELQARYGRYFGGLMVYVVSVSIGLFGSLFIIMIFVLLWSGKFSR